jgi:hypothetical protein
MNFRAILVGSGVLGLAIIVLGIVAGIVVLVAESRKK